MADDPAPRARYSRHATGRLAAAVATDSDTATWQLSCLPNSPQYCRASWSRRSASSRRLNPTPPCKELGNPIQMDIGVRCPNTLEALFLANHGPPYQDVRALQRGLKIMEILGQMGWTKPRVLSDLTSIDRSSTYRLLNTLAGSGYVTKRSDDGSYALTSKINLIADGFTQNELACQVVAPHLEDLTKEISWPSDFAMLKGGEVIIVESTHRISPMTTYRAMIGKTRSLTQSSLGRAILSAMRGDELDIALNMYAKLGGPNSRVFRNRSLAAKIAREVKEHGYASAVGTYDTKISAIALPVRAHSAVIGAVNVIFFRSALTISEAADRYLEKLRSCVDRIEKDLSNAPFETVRMDPVDHEQRRKASPRQTPRASGQNERSVSH